MVAILVLCNSSLEIDCHLDGVAWRKEEPPFCLVGYLAAAASDIYTPQMATRRLATPGLVLIISPVSRTATIRVARCPFISQRFHATHAFGDTVEDAPPAVQPPRRYWSKQEIKKIYDTPLLELVFKAAQAHRETQDPSKVQLCTLMNIKSKSRGPLSPN